jgi:hypothetical protein
LVTLEIYPVHAFKGLPLSWKDLGL